jgi:hypothetical protein
MKNKLLSEFFGKSNTTLLVLVFLVTQGFTSSVFGTIIPADRLPAGGMWVNAGVPGGIQNRTNIFVNLRTTTNPSYHCAADGATDDSTAIINAINACPNNQVVYAPAGTYRCASQIRIYATSYWTLRGDGPGKTIFTGGGSALFSLGNSPWLTSWPAATAITGGATKGSTSITVASTANIANNQILWIEQADDGVNVFGVGSGASGSATANPDDRMHNNTHCLNVRVLVTNITGTTVGFVPPLPVDFNNSPSAIGFGGQVGPRYAGLENFTANGSTVGQGISYQSAFGCWMTNVELMNYYTFGFEFGWCACMEARHCYTHDPYAYNYSDGYAMQFDACNNSLIEDCIFWHNTTALIIQGGSVGNVFGYNFMFQPINHISTNAQAQALYANHTPYPTMNLWEGNCGSGFQMDFYYGPGSRNTLFRNWLNCNDPDVTGNRVAVSMDSHQWSNSVVANILGSSGTSANLYAALPNQTFVWVNKTPVSWIYNGGWSANPAIFRLGYPFSGNDGYTAKGYPPTSSQLSYYDGTVVSNTIIHGNYDWANMAVTWSPNIADHTIPASYYLSGKPAYFGNLAWPPYDPANSSAASITNIPAGYRFVFGVDPPSGGADTTPPTISNITVSPLTTNSVTVAWSTDEPATSIVDYGATVAYGTSVTNSSLVSIHSLAIGNISIGITNHYRIRSADASGNMAASLDDILSIPPVGLQIISP